MSETLTVFLIVLNLCEYALALEVLIAWSHGWLTVRQMTDRHIFRGTPLSVHGGIYSRFFLISFLIAFIVARYHSQWSGLQLAVLGVAGFVATYTLCKIEKKSLFQGAYLRNGRLTEAGRIRFVYRWATLSVLPMYYCRGMTMADLPPASLISAILVYHAFLENDAALRWIKPDWSPWGPLLKDPLALYTIIVTAMLTVGRVLWLGLVGW